MTKRLKKKEIVLFEGEHIRRHWDEEKELWYFSVSDVIAILTESADPVAYWRKLKERLLKEGGNETVTKCHGLKRVVRIDRTTKKERIFCNNTTHSVRISI